MQSAPGKLYEGRRIMEEIDIKSIDELKEIADKKLKDGTVLSVTFDEGGVGCEG